MNNNIAFLIIDVQNGLFSIPDAIIHNSGKMISNILELINKARKSKTPIIYIQHCSQSGGVLEPNTQGWNIYPDISPIQGDLIIKKSTPDSFHDTMLKEELERRGIKRLVVVGLQTEYCIDTTCRRVKCPPLSRHNFKKLSGETSFWGDFTKRYPIPDRHQSGICNLVIGGAAHNCIR